MKALMFTGQHPSLVEAQAQHTIHCLHCIEGSNIHPIVHHAEGEEAYRKCKVWSKMMEERQILGIHGGYR